MRKASCHELIEEQRRYGEGRYVCLGSGPATEAARARIRGETLDDEAVWGTLGIWDLDDAPSWRPAAWGGELLFSQRGSLRSTADRSGQATMTEIHDVRAGWTATEARRRQVNERFLSFEALDLPDDWPASFSWKEVPALRLTLLLRPDEGALVFYQHMDRRPRGRPGAVRDGTAAQYLLPEATRDHACGERDRLHYRIPVLPDRQAFEEDRRGHLRRRKLPRRAGKLVVKVLTFRRGNTPSVRVIERTLDRLGLRRHRLLRFSRSEADFVPVAQVRRVPTLLLLHGTFQTTRGSFGPLLEGGQSSWMSSLVAERLGQGRYEQVLAFDHRTVLTDLPGNADALLEALRGASLGPTTVLTQSRGGQLAKHLGYFHRERMPIVGGALCACANGVGYFTALDRIALGLSVLKSLLLRAGRAEGAAIAALAQHSAEVVADLPGFQCMRMEKGADWRRLQAVPAGLAPPFADFQVVAGDWKRSLVRGEPLLRRLGARGLDRVIRGFLGREHDWVVGTERQVDDPDGHPFDPPARVAALHTSYFVRPQVRAAIWKRI